MVGLLIIARLYLGVDHPSDAVFAAMLGFAVAVLVFKLFVPESVFPVVNKRGVTAHLDVGGARGVAIKQAVQDQLGIEVLELKPFGLEGSGGSTPLRLTVPNADPGEPDVHLFAKLYSQTHLRSDRWYKVGRTILYGSLEDEVKFSSVRRLVEYEDYIMLRMQEAGLPSAHPYGIVEITPEREYLLVTEFLFGAQELGDAIVDDSIIDQGLLMIRQLWDAGLAHRDIKPANVMVHDGEVKLIDVAFATVRPSPWRQAVDLANMMIILGLRHDPSHVYRSRPRLLHARRHCRSVRGHQRHHHSHPIAFGSQAVHRRPVSPTSSRRSGIWLPHVSPSRCNAGADAGSGSPPAPCWLPCGSSDSSSTI